MSQLASELAKNSLPFALLTRPGLQHLPIEDYVKAIDILVDPQEFGSGDVPSGSQAQVFRAYLNGMFSCESIRNAISKTPVSVSYTQARWWR